MLYKERRTGGPRRSSFISRHIIQAANQSFDDFAGSNADQAANRRMMGLD